jgi:nitroimidazol reductase NimA-like FMN-containing flavoprotein (pyridoxamine 5'-phosphate oxidase superfamily)
VNREDTMDQSFKDFVLNVIESANDLTLATVRPDGYPQATTVSFAHDGLNLYVGIGKHSQKADNIRHNSKVSLTINLPYQDWREIKGLSMSALAEIVDDSAGVVAARACLLNRCPQIAEWGDPTLASEVAFLKITPQVISILDYSKGFGHTELATA